MVQLPILSITIFIPLAAASLVLLLPAERERWIKNVALAAAALTLALTVMVYFRYDVSAGGYQFLERAAWVPQLGISYFVGLDGVSLPLLLLAGVVLFSGVLVSWNVSPRPKEFFAFLLFLATSVLGVFASLDIFQLFFFFELPGLP